MPTQLKIVHAKVTSKSYDDSVKAIDGQIEGMIASGREEDAAWLQGLQDMLKSGKKDIIKRANGK